MNKRDELLQYISDAHKDAYGVRPGATFAALSVEELEIVADTLSDAVCETIERERAEMQANRDAFEASVAAIIEAGAGDRETAVRWLLDAEGLADETDMGYIQYRFGVGYNYDLIAGVAS